MLSVPDSSVNSWMSDTTGQFHENVDTALKIQLDLTVFFAFLR